MFVINEREYRFIYRKRVDWTEVYSLWCRFCRKIKLDREVILEAEENTALEILQNFATLRLYVFALNFLFNWESPTMYADFLFMKDLKI